MQVLEVFLHQIFSVPESISGRKWVNVLRCRADTITAFPSIDSQILVEAGTDVFTQSPTNPGFMFSCQDLGPQLTLPPKEERQKIVQ